MSFDYKQTDFETAFVDRRATCQNAWKCGGRTRFLVLLIGLICITCTNANMILMNFTVICMSDVVADQKTINSTHWLEKTSDVSLTFSAAAIGAIFGTIPAVTLIAKYGIRRVLTIYGLLSAAGTLLMPLAVRYGLVAVLVARLFQGIGASVLYSSIGSISEAWSSVAELGTYVAFLSSAFQISNIVTMPTAGVLCESALGWRSIYYLFGGITVLVYLVFYLFYTDSPERHRNVSDGELKKIRVGKSVGSGGGNSKNGAKFSQVFRNLEVFEISVAIVGGSAAVICLNNYGPIYLNKVLGLNIRETGYSNAIPYLFAAIVKFAAGPVTDRMQHVGERTRLILFALAPQITMAAGFLVMSFTTTVLVAQCAYTVSVVLAGLNVIGMVKCAQIVAKEHLSLVMAVISMSSWLAAFVLPVVIGVVCPTNSHAEWSRFYLAVAVFVVVTNVPFPFFARVSENRRVAPATKF